MSIVSILSISIGLLGIVVTVLYNIVRVDDGKKFDITPGQSVLLVLCCAMVCFGAVYLVCFFLFLETEDDSYHSYQSTENYIEQNLDTILQKKSEYSYNDTLLIKYEFVEFCISEKAGGMFYDFEGVGELTLGGKDISRAIVCFLDYNTNEIICILNSDEDGYVRYYPEADRKFYCVAFAPEYEMYVSEPILVEGGEEFKLVNIFLDAINSEYTSTFQIRIQTWDNSIQPIQNFSILSHCNIGLRCVECSAVNHESFRSRGYGCHTNDLGIVSFGPLSYLKLNTKYMLDVSLNMLDTSSNQPLEFYSAPYETIDSSNLSTNLIDIRIEYNGSRIAPQQIIQ